MVPLDLAFEFILPRCIQRRARVQVDKTVFVTKYFKYFRLFFSFPQRFIRNDILFKQMFKVPKICDVNLIFKIIV